MSTTLLRLAPLLCGLLVKTTLILLAAWTAALFLRRASAAARHLVWTAAIGSILLLPALSASLPHWSIAWRHSAAPIRAVSPQSGVSTVIVSERQTQAPLTDVSGVSPKQNHFRITLSGVALIGFSVWLNGCLAALARLAAGLTRIERTRRRARDLEGPAMLLAKEAARSLGVRRHIQTRLAASAHDVDVPVTWGAVRPVILLPSHSASWSEDCLRVALLHETAHVRRLDWATQIASRAACAVLWFHPLIWLAASRMREESENACDDLVMRSGVSATDYAQRLVDIVRSMPEKGRAYPSAVAMAQPWEVERRVTTVLAKEKNRSPIHSRGLAAAIAALTALLLPLAALRVTTPARAATISQAGVAASKTASVIPQSRTAGRASATPPAKRFAPSSKTLHTRDATLPIKRKTTMKPLPHTMIIAGLAAAAVPVHAQSQAVPGRNVAPPVNTITDSPLSSGARVHSLSAASGACASATASSSGAETGAADPHSRNDVVRTEATITLTDSQGKIVSSSSPCLILLPGLKGKVSSVSTANGMTDAVGEMVLEVSSTVAADKSVVVSANLQEKAMVDGKMATYRPTLIAKVGQKAATTLSDEHGVLRFEITPTLEKSQSPTHPSPGTPAASAGTGTASPAHPQ